MALYYFDTSALVKYYVPEPGSTWVRRLINAQITGTQLNEHLVFIAEITQVEVAAGLAAITRGGRLIRSERNRAYHHFSSQLTRRYTVLRLTTEDFQFAADLTQIHPLKAYDAIQLAVALRYQQNLSQFDLTLHFISGDRTLLTAAQSEGLAIDNPFDHLAPEDTPN